MIIIRISNGGKLRNDNHSHLHLASLLMHQHGDVAVQQCTKAVLATTHHIRRSASSQGVGIGKLLNVTMSLYARARVGERFNIVLAHPPHASHPARHHKKCTQKTNIV